MHFTFFWKLRIGDERFVIEVEAVRGNRERQRERKTDRETETDRQSDRKTKTDRTTSQYSPN